MPIIRKGTKRTSLRRRCDALWAKIVKDGGVCARCGALVSDAAHVVPRRFFSTRWLIENGRPLCRACHEYFTNHEAAWRNYIGSSYDELWELAQKVWDKDYLRVLVYLEDIAARKTAKPLKKGKRSGTEREVQKTTKG